MKKIIGLLLIAVLLSSCVTSYKCPSYKDKEGNVKIDKSSCLPQTKLLGFIPLG